MNNLILFWNNSYQIPKSLFSKRIMFGDSYTLSIKWQSCYLQNVCVKKSNFHRTLLRVIGTRVCSVARLPLAIVTKHKPYVTNGLKAWISNQAGQFMSLIQYHPCDCSYLSTERVTMLNIFPEMRWPRRQVQQELRSTIFSENIDNLRIPFFNGNNDGAAWALFVKHSRAHGEWLRQNPERSEGFDVIIRPEPSGASQTTLAQPRSLNLN